MGSLAVCRAPAVTWPTYHVMTTGFRDVGKVVEGKLYVLPARCSDQPRTAQRAVASAVSNPSRQISTRPSHQYLTPVTSAASFCWWSVWNSGHCTYIVTFVAVYKITFSRGRGEPVSGDIQTAELLRALVALCTVQYFVISKKVK